jgi:hypothetical protein
MESYPEAGFGLTSYFMPDDTFYPKLLSPTESYYHYFFKNALIHMGPTGAIIKKEAFDFVKGFSGKPFLGDTEMWLKMSRYFPLVVLPRDLTWWRQHEGQQIIEEVKDKKNAMDRFRLIQDALEHEECPLPEKLRKAAQRNFTNNQGRKIIMQLIKGKICPAINDSKYLRLDISDIIRATRRNKYYPLN